MRRTELHGGPGRGAASAHVPSAEQPLDTGRVAPPPTNGGDQPGPRALSKRAKCAFGSGIDPTIAFHLCQRLPPCFFNGADQLCRKMAFQERLKRGQVEAPFCPCSIGYL